MFTPTIEEGIKDIIRRMMNGVLQKRLVDEPWNLEQETTSKPFHFSLAPEKEKMLKIKAMYPEENHHVFYALPFNPFGQRENYSHAHPKRWFDMINDEVVLMGKEFWDILGGEGAYEELIEIFEEVGQEYRPRINRDYFGLTE